jgi:hypothetical protein
MTESGYKLAEWLLDHKDNTVVFVSYIGFVILLIIMIAIYVRSPQKDVGEKMQYYNVDYEQPYQK